MFNHMGGDSGAVSFVQAASKRLADAGPGGGNDHCFSHRNLLNLCCGNPSTRKGTGLARLQRTPLLTERSDTLPQKRMVLRNKFSVTSAITCSEGKRNSSLAPGLPNGATLG